MIDPINEVNYRLRLAEEHLKRAEALYGLNDWAGCIHYSQLAVENFAKAVIAVFGVPTWSHDPSNQLLSLVNQLPRELSPRIEELARLSHEVASEHARSTYGEPTSGLTPSAIYSKDYATDILNKARRARDLAHTILRALGVPSG